MENQNNKIFTPLTNRENRIHFLYLFFLFKLDIKEIKELLHQDNFYKFTDKEKNSIIKIIENSDFLIDKLTKKIINWSWDRINNLEKSILLNALGEILIFKNKKAIVINESLNYTKKYCQKESSNFINGILNNFD